MSLQCHFEKSASTLVDCPRWDRREIAIAGRYNVGKSSLLNALVGIKGLARTSRTPGRTQALNFFTVGDNLALVDLPGYGYARIPEALAQRIGVLMTDFLAQRVNLSAVLLLIDARRGPREEEFELAGMVRGRNLELIVAATKCDKIRRGERPAMARRFDALNAPLFPCSAIDGEGLEPLRRRLFKISRAHGLAAPLNRHFHGREQQG